MADMTELRLWPCCPFAIDWSYDGVVALAAEDHVEILFPNAESYDVHGGVAWHSVELRANEFTTAEVPSKEPAPSRIFSIGEEISSSYPVGISWSPPGLAKHRWCALACRTSNLVLSIWSPEHKIRDASNWGRKLIINHTLEQYYHDFAEAGGNYLPASFEDEARVFARIRAYTWAPTILAQPGAPNLGTRPFWGPHLLAVSNDHNDVIFLAIDSPASSLGEKEWTSEVVGTFTLEDVETSSEEAEIFDEIMEKQVFVSQLSWGPWVVKNGLAQSVLAYTANKYIAGRTITYVDNNIKLGPEMIYMEKDVMAAVTLKWVPKTGTGGQSTLVLVMDESIVHLTISTLDASLFSRADFRLPGYWENPITGALFDIHTRESPILHLSSLISTARNATSAFEISSSEMVALDRPSWHLQIDNAQGLFSAQNELAGNTRAKVWGLAASPLGDHILASYSLHPSDMIEYGPGADRQTTLVVSKLRRNGKQIKFPEVDASAEAVFYSIRKYIDNYMDLEFENRLDEAPPAVSTKLKSTYAPDAAQQEATSGNTVVLKSPPSLEALVTDLKTQAFLDPRSVRDRCDVLKYVVFNEKDPDELELSKTMIAYRLASVISQFDHALLTPSLLSNHIKSFSHDAVRLITSVLSPSPPNLATEREAAESCLICSSPIPFTNLWSATCKKGHRFARCGLSFLALQAPGVTKYCNICSTPFLSDEFLARNEMVGSRGPSAQPETVPLFEHMDAKPVIESQSGAGIKGGVQVLGSFPGFGDAKPVVEGGASDGTVTPRTVEEWRPERVMPVTLARVLFLACDVCIYCGGKFVG
ncbi:hypothetical protein EJ04DRAFT_573018 [Polyplosphaeria fusca]|uniref:Transcription factor IIIC 90kDa subunit N-terminal domain-containing protein n=1 Tax=Polyplosphaeria fusca TaxID=682080 RepID=A0A9P4R509_9PLEO|nr:hypothetical protein EJ04DRAFT_573018 [Polyplosphaeria fusca]